MFVLGLTGSIGMGKTTTARLFAEEGVPVHDADAAVARLYEGAAVPAVEDAFPGSTVGGKVDREKLWKVVFNDPTAMRKLESIVHPLVQKEEKEFLAEVERRGATVAVLDIPLLFETGREGRTDAVVVVTAPAEVQRQRVMARPGMTEEKLRELVSRQVPDREKRKRADFIVDTGQGIEHARAQVRAILAEIAKMPKKK